MNQNGSKGFRGELVCLAVMWCAVQTSLAGDVLNVATVSRPAEWTINFEGKPVLVYASDPQKFKPYVKASQSKVMACCATRRSIICTITR